MPIQFNCDQCQSVLQTPDELVGKNCKCPTCGNVMAIPSPETLSTSAPDPSAAFEPPAEQNPYAKPDPPPFLQPIANVNPFTTSGGPELSGVPDFSHLEHHRGDTILMLGIFSLITASIGCGCCGLTAPIGFGLGIPAVIMAKTDTDKMERGLMNPAGRGNTNAGKICGIIGMVLGGLGLTLFTVQFILGIVGNF